MSGSIIIDLDVRKFHYRLFAMVEKMCIFYSNGTEWLHRNTYPDLYPCFDTLFQKTNTGGVPSGDGNGLQSLSLWFLPR